MSDTYHHGNLKNALIEAGIEVVASDGLQALSLRKVAKKAGVSHNAPYAHFADKQALIAAIATNGYTKLLKELTTAAANFPDNPTQRLVEVAWAYVQFAVSNPAHFKVTFSGIVENEANYPDYVELSKKSLQLVIDLVVDCQLVGILTPNNTDLFAMSIWASIHGFLSLLQGNLIPSSLLNQYTLRELLVFHIKTTVPFTETVDLK